MKKAIALFLQVVAMLNRQNHQAVSCRVQIAQLQKLT